MIHWLGLGALSARAPIRSLAGELRSHKSLQHGHKQLKKYACNAGDLGSIPGLGRPPREGKGYLLQYSGLENSMDYSPWGHKESDMTEQISLHFTIHVILKILFTGL